jgi:hypothetical protein
MSNELGLFTTDGRKTFRPGETLELSALWALAAPPATLEARLFWFTRGKGTEDVKIVATQALATADSAGETRVVFTLPAAPYSFSGKLVSLLWAAELVAGQLSARCEFTLSPTGAELVLGGGILPRPS